MEAILRTEHISKRFGDFYANKDINLSVEKGEVHTLLGENGAGKSTLMNILIGLYQPSEGQIFINGKPVKISSPDQAVSLGIGMVHQHFMLVDAMTVFENIILGDRKAGGLFIDREARRKEILELSERYGLSVELDRKIPEISVGAQQRVEILKALYRGADLLILDEPTAALTDIEVEGLYRIIDRLKSEGKSIIFISHKMREVLKLSDRISVLRAGRLVATIERQKVDGARLAELMIGKTLTEASYRKEDTPGSPVISLKNIVYNNSSKHNSLNGISLTVGQGEIVGIAGVDGNGQTQLAQIAAGVIRPAEGEVTLLDNKVSLYDPNSFIRQGVAHIVEDRIREGLIGDMSIADNLVLKSIDSAQFSYGHGAHIRKRMINRFAHEMSSKYDIRCTDTDQDVRNLSGGNQQKVILARELESDPSLLIAVHPARGLDIGATRFIHDRIIEARDRKVGVLLISADFDEILELSDRILVLFEGGIIGEYSGINPPVKDISIAMTGENNNPQAKGIRNRRQT